MKKTLILLSALTLVSCVSRTERKTGFTVIKGVVSSIEKGSIGRGSEYPKIYVQTPKNTKEVEIPFQNEKDFKIGDSCILIIEKYVRYE